ncbi:protein FAM234A isoform X1 [Paramormyrops kingsleyae]|uniref:protein FAM234A isoform X1 n=2 Tax=Paramormyrops kingsleyae TaxID=1676925 RepID=UPI003B9784CB
MNYITQKAKHRMEARTPNQDPYGRAHGSQCHRSQQRDSERAGVWVVCSLPLIPHLQGGFEMSDLVDGRVEAQPLKERVAKAPRGKSQASGTKARRLARLSRCRTAVFFISLFLCLTVVFAFSFIIPCPVRPVYLRTWNHTYLESATYDFLAVEDVNRDKVLDVLFVLEANVGTMNTSCTIESIPCVFMVAVAGTNGHTLWERPLAPPFHWAQCGLQGLGGTDSGCLVAHAHLLTAVNKNTGDFLWQRPHPPNFNSQLPVMTSPDLDGDKVEDLVLIGPGPVETKLAVLSGRAGSRIGPELVLIPMETTKHLLHSTGSGSHYVLFRTALGLHARALWRIAAEVQPGSEKTLRREPAWEAAAEGTSEQPLRSAVIHWLVQVPKKRGGHSLLLVTGGAVELVDGDSLQSLWTTNVSGVLSQPSTGYYDKDDITDVVLEEDSGNGTKRVAILNGRSGLVQWQLILLARPNTPQPVSFRSIHTISVFVFWGQMVAPPDAMRPSSEDTFTYMLHPQHPDAVLESSTWGGGGQTVTLRATLLERSRHACFITLAAPAGAGPSVTLSKRKLKDDASRSHVCWLGDHGEHQDEDVKYAFERLRFHQEA